jgi:hypothetical protein
VLIARTLAGLELNEHEMGAEDYPLEHIYSPGRRYCSRNGRRGLAYLYVMFHIGVASCWWLGIREPWAFGSVVEGGWSLARKGAAKRGCKGGSGCNGH